MVLVILAILAAILVPALLGWIDEAKEKQYVLDARNVYLATQAVADEEYAKGVENMPTTFSVTETNGERIQKMADVSFSTISDIKYAKRELAETEAGGASTMKAAAIESMVINDLGPDNVTATLGSGTWTITEEP